MCPHAFVTGCQSMKLENIKVINISGVARNCRDEKSNTMHNFIANINIFVNADTQTRSYWLFSKLCNCEISHNYYSI